MLMRDPSPTTTGGTFMRIRMLALTVALVMGAVWANAQAPGGGAASSPAGSSPAASGARRPGFPPNATAFVVTFKVKPGKNAAFEEIFRGMEMKVRDNEPGNLSYDLYRTGQPQTYVIVERYRDPAAVAAHGKDAGNLMVGLRDLLDGPPSFQALTLLSSK
jgi:quinol monooxygenase YgiN